MENKDQFSKEIKYGITIPFIQKLNQPGNKSLPPNVMIISIDTLRGDYLGYYRKLINKNSNFSYSPNIDKIASQATVFTKAFTTESATWPGLASMLLSLYPNEHGCMYNGDLLKFNYYSIASFFLDMGYQTLSLNANAFILNIAGFERKLGFIDDKNMVKGDFRNCDQKLIRKALVNLNKFDNTPFFHWYHLMGTHAAYRPPEWIMEIVAEGKKYRHYDLDSIMNNQIVPSGKDLDYIKKLYAGELYHLDLELKKIVCCLKEKNLYDNTMLIITSDHGEDLYQHNRFFYHYPSLYNSSIHIPMIIKFPFQKKQKVYQNSVSILDIFPTLYNYYKGDDNTDLVFSGISLLRLMAGEIEPFNRRVIYSGVENFKILSARYKDWNLIYNPLNLSPIKQNIFPYPYQAVELYNMKKDYNESQMVNNQKIRDFLIGKINNFSKNSKLLIPKDVKKTGKISDKDREKIQKRLKALGYIK